MVVKAAISFKLIFCNDEKKVYWKRASWIALNQHEPINIKFDATIFDSENVSSQFDLYNLAMY